MINSDAFTGTQITSIPQSIGALVCPSAHVFTSVNFMQCSQGFMHTCYKYRPSPSSVAFDIDKPTLPISLGEAANSLSLRVRLVV